VAIPVRIHTATKVSFHLLHNKCGSRVRNQHYCPVCNVVVERDDLIRGFQHAKDQYMQIIEEELENLEAEANRSIDLKEFIPLASVDPVYLKTLIILAPTKAVRSLTGCSLMPWQRAARVDPAVQKRISSAHDVSR
jgi:DNA end-binding protein Ku